MKLDTKFKIFATLKVKPFPMPQDKPRVLIFLAADYGNLGDVAITFAQKKLLQELFPSHVVVEVPAAKTLTSLNSIKKQITPEDIVTVVGGGNMGDMYYDIELLRLMVVEKFRKNRIILFPQTIDYSDSREARYLLKKSQRIYSKAKNLIMLAREKVSYDKMKEYYPDVDVRLTPDVVMTLNEVYTGPRENRVLFCLRNDKEKESANDAIVSEIENIVKTDGIEIVQFDTHIGGDRYSEEEKYRRLRELWDEFGKSRLVVTDRLHGMIFAFITGTPAIVLPNSNFKVRACYDWLAPSGFIHLLDNN